MTQKIDAMCAIGRFVWILSMYIVVLSGVDSAATPNVIFALADDLGWGDVYNGGQAFTPNLKRMARSEHSIRLQRHYSGSPVCSPTRATVLTGRNHNRYCVWGANRGSWDLTQPQRMPLPLSEITVAEVMRNSGYSTALFGKWHLGDFKPLQGGNSKWPVSHPGVHGFEQWWATGRSAPTATTNCGCFEKSTCIRGHRQSCVNYYTNTSYGVKEWPNLIPGDDSHFIWHLAEKYIREQVNLKKPFFLYLPFHSVHFPVIAINEYHEAYLQANYSSKQADYYGAISAVDDVIGRLRRLLKELGIKNNTLFWFTSDNGPTLKQGSTNGLRGHKGSLYEGGVRVPGIIEWPDVISNNGASHFPVVTSDLLPTVQDILGVKPSDDRPIDGISILPFLQGKMKQRDQPIFSAYHIRRGHFGRSYNISVTTDRYKLIETYKKGTIINYELYDLKKDKHEKNNLKKSYPDIENKLLQQTEEWRQSVMESIRRVGCSTDY